MPDFRCVELIVLGECADIWKRDLILRQYAWDATTPANCRLNIASAYNAIRKTLLLYLQPRPQEQSFPKNFTVCQRH